MCKLRYYYGSMNSMKSATLLMKAHQFEQSGCKVILMKPSVDIRDFGIIKSRPMESSRECILIKPNDNIENLVKTMLKFNNKKTIIFIDEVQFLTEQQVEQLFFITEKYNVEVFTYGLKLSYKNELFKASERLLVLADTVEEIKSMCKCGRKATTHLRFINNKVVTKGQDFLVGDINGSEKYESVCQRCWHKQIKNK